MSEGRRRRRHSGRASMKFAFNRKSRQESRRNVRRRRQGLGLERLEGRTLLASLQSVVDTYGSLPLSFEANQGQADAQAAYLARGDGYALFLTPTESVLALRSVDGET